MLKTNGVLKFIDYINEQIYFYEESNEKANEKELKYFYVLRKIFTMDLADYYFENLNIIIFSIINTNMPLHIRLECVCYIFNVNKEFFCNNSNFEIYFKHSKFETLKRATLEFNRLALYYDKLGRIINSRNRINPIDKLENEDIYFRIINFPEYASGQIIDTALRNYQLNVIYNLRKTKN